MKKVLKKTSKLAKSSSLSEKEPGSSVKKEEIKKSEDDQKIKPLKQEIKTLDLLNSLLLQWSYSNFLLDFSFSEQEAEANNQIYDRGKQLIDLSKTVSSLSIENHAREKNKVLDDILSMEYSNLKSIEEDILMSSEYLKELEENSHGFLNRLDLNEGVVISPQELSGKLSKSAYELKQLSSLVEDEAKEVKTLAEDFQDLVDIFTEKEKELAEIKELEQEILDLQSQEQIKVVESVIKKRGVLIKKLVTEDFND